MQSCDHHGVESPTEGRTLPAAIIDLEIGRGVSGIASYVAITRVRQRTETLTLGPFTGRSSTFMDSKTTSQVELLLTSRFADVVQLQPLYTIRYCSEISHLYTVKIIRRSIY